MLGVVEPGLGRPERDPDPIRHIDERQVEIEVEDEDRAGAWQAVPDLQRQVFAPWSQHDTPAAPVAHVPLQSVSAVHALGAGGVDAGVAAGNLVSAGAGSVGDVSSAGTSALFALTSHAELEPVAEAFAETGAVLVQTNLSPEDEAALRETFGED